MFLRVGCCLIALNGLIASPALAAETGEAAADAAPAGEIIVTGQRGPAAYKPELATSAKVNAPLRDIPQTINVISGKVIEDQGALSLQDVLKNVPGVGFSHGDGQRDQVSIRGFTGIADQFVDGLRDDALYFRDLSNIERVEVIKGPASVLYGRGSSGGLINRVRKIPARPTWQHRATSARSTIAGAKWTSA